MGGALRGERGGGYRVAVVAAAPTSTAQQGKQRPKAAAHTCTSARNSSRRSAGGLAFTAAITSGGSMRDTSFSSCFSSFEAMVRSAPPVSRAQIAFVAR
jgi:hypothetical protein